MGHPNCKKYLGLESLHPKKSFYFYTTKNFATMFKSKSNVFLSIVNEMKTFAKDYILAKANIRRIPK